MLRYVLKTAAKSFTAIPKKLTLSMGDIVATEASPGHDIGIVTLTGELVKVQMKKKHVKRYARNTKKYTARHRKKI